MNRLYKTLDLYAGWLVETESFNNYGGIKNIIGIKVIYNGEQLFYSILDNCFFQILPNKEILENISENNYKRLFVDIYEYQKPPFEFKTLGMRLFEKVKKEYVSKQQLICYKKFLEGHYSDLDYEFLEVNTNIDVWNSIDKNIVKTVQQYEEKLKRPITYEEHHIYGPKKEKVLK